MREGGEQQHPDSEEYDPVLYVVLVAVGQRGIFGRFQLLWRQAAKVLSQPRRLGCAVLRDLRAVGDLITLGATHDGALRGRGVGERKGGEQRRGAD